MSKKESNPLPPCNVKRPPPPPAPPPKRFIQEDVDFGKLFGGRMKINNTPFIHGDRQQNSYALAERIIEFFEQIKKLDKKHIEDRNQLLKDLLDYMIEHPSIYTKKAMESMLVNYFSNFSCDGLDDLHEKFKEYKENKTDSPLEVSREAVSKDILKQNENIRSTQTKA